MKRKIIYVTAGEIFEIRVLPEGYGATAKDWKTLKHNDHLDIHYTYQFKFADFQNLLVPRIIRPAISVAGDKWTPERNLCSMS